MRAGEQTANLNNLGFGAFFRHLTSGQQMATTDLYKILKLNTLLYTKFHWITST